IWAMEEKPKPTSRRTFVKAAIVGGATAAVVGTAVLGPGLRPSVEAGPASFPQVGSHLVWLDKGENLFRRRNLLTGTDEYSHADGALVVQSAIDALPLGTGGVILLPKGPRAPHRGAPRGKENAPPCAPSGPPP